VKLAARAAITAKNKNPTIKNMCRLFLLKCNREIICSIFDFYATIFRRNEYDNPPEKKFMLRRGKMFSARRTGSVARQHQVF
jgi:hypothetical protein